MSRMIEMDHITFSYRVEEGEEPVVLFRDFTFSVEKGSFVAVVGHNGSGKSTIAKLSNGLYLPDSGKVVVNGMDTADSAKELEVRKTVGLVFQNPDNQLVSTIVEEDVAFGPENLGLPRAEIRQRVDSALRAVDMYDYREHDTHRLSGGQKQRIAIAGIIAMQPECIVLDEPTAMLDPRGRAEVMRTIEKLNHELGITVVLITHYMEEAAKASRVVVMDTGKIVLDGTPKQVFSRADVLKQVGLDLPQPCELANELRQKGLALPAEILTVEDCLEALAKLLEVQKHCPS